MRWGLGGGSVEGRWGLRWRISAVRARRGWAIGGGSCAMALRVNA